MNAGQFQSRSQAELEAQEMALRRLSNGQQEQQLNAAPRQSPALDHETASRVSQSLNKASNAFDAQTRLLGQSALVSDKLMNLVNALASQVQAQEDAIKLGVIANQLSNAFLNELNAAHNMIDVQNRMLSSPMFLLAHSFQVFANTIQIGDREAIDLISSYYLDLVKGFEDKILSATGRYSPEYSQYLEQNINAPSPQSPQYYQSAQNAAVGSVTSFAEGLKTPGFAQSLKRAHTSRNSFR
jgi:hypothetical protein